jgi:hypothetical protein
VEDVLKRRDTGGYWGRPMFSTPKRFDRFRMVSGAESSGRVGKGGRDGDQYRGRPA